MQKNQNNINYQKELDKLIEKITAEAYTPSLILHSCCAPCSSYVIEYLSDFFNITVFYYNPNLYPDEEYAKRSQEQKKLIENIKTKNKVSFLQGDFEKDEFYALCKGLENEPECGLRCLKCYELRLSKTAKKAQFLNADYFATTLTISPMKRASDINNIGEKISKNLGIKYLASDFKKKNGYKRSTELSNEYGIYRQDYCGCIFSVREKSKTQEKSKAV